MKIKISKIKIGDRFRKDLGDITSLSESIDKLGLLQPIGVDSGNALVFGERRLRAHQSLGLETIEASVIKIESIIDGEFAENEIRKSFTMSERVSIAEAIADKYKDRQGKGKESDISLVPTLAQVKGKKTIEIVAEQSGFGGKETYRKAKKIVSYGDDELIEKVDTGQITVHNAHTQIKRKEKEEKREEKREENRQKISENSTEEEITGLYSTIVIDPPWNWGDEGDNDQMGRSKPDYSTMTIDELKALKVGELAEENAHIYLWITNRSLPKGFDLLEAWGFRYITALTWVKPSFGLGNYFRGQTEHVLFGVKGSQLLKRKDVGTVFMANRGDNGHSSKPNEFYDLVESCSYGPYLEMFSRHDAEDWSTWGENGNK